MPLEDRSLNTAQNAQMSLVLPHQRGARRILLVTSAPHIRRALAQFRAESFHVVPPPLIMKAAIRGPGLGGAAGCPAPMRWSTARGR